MAATSVTVQTINEAGLIPVTPVAGDQANGMSVPNSGGVFLRFVNGASAQTVTVAFPNKIHGQTIPAKSYSLAANTELWPGPFDPSVFGATLIFTPSAATVTVAAYQLSYS